MSLLISCLAGVASALAVWLVRGALAVESASAGAPKVGVLPPVWQLVALTALALALVVLIRPSRERVTPLFITLLCVMPWLPGVRTPALMAWTGPLGAAVLLAAAAAVAIPWMIDRSRRAAAPAFSNPRRAPVLAAAFALAFFAVIAYGARESVPGGDEPHYLIITQSLLYDHDLQIENNHARGDYTAYFQGTLRPDYLVRGKNGQIYSVHAPGLPVLLVPAFAIGGYRGAEVFLLFCSAAVLGIAWSLGFVLTRSASAAWFGALAMTVATPIAFHSFTIYPDGIASGLLLTGIWALFRLVPDLRISRGSTRAWVLHGTALALLPWIHTRFAILSGLLAVVILLRMPRTREGVVRAVAFLTVPVASALAWFGFFYVIYGTPDPNVAYGTWAKYQSDFRFVTGGLSGLFFDQQFGILPYAPVFAVAAAGFIVLAKRWPRLAVELALVSIPYFVAITHLRMWWGGWSAPARFAMAALLQGSFLSALAWNVARSRAARATAIGALLVSAFTTTALAFVQGGRLAYNVRDGYSLWLEWISPLADLPLGFPSFFRSFRVEWAMDLQMLFALGLFIAAFGVVWWIERRFRPERGTTALLVLAFNALAGMVMLAVLWNVNDATGLRAAASQVRLLRVAAARGARGVLYGEFSIVSTDAAVSSLRIESPPRLVSGSDAPALAIPGWVPAGEYRITMSAAASTAPATYEVRTMRLDRPIADGEFTGGVDVPLALPVAAPAILVRGRNLASGWVRPVRVESHAVPPADARATTAQRYGNVISWFLDNNAFVEPDGFWVRGAQSAEVVLQPRTPGTRQLVLSGHNGATTNRVTFQADKWREELALTPGQSFDVSVPLEAAAHVSVLRITSPAGFRPADVERGNADRRFLGVWVSPR